MGTEIVAGLLGPNHAKSAAGKSAVGLPDTAEENRYKPIVSAVPP
ncbi:hypothetical protein [Streptomyces sp. NPDC001100]